ncbi:phage tail protein [Vibrio cholerae]|nr:phage tail protein [Vibrio cholerae]
MSLDMLGEEQVKAMILAMPDQVRKALRDTLNKSAKISHERAVKEMAEEYNLSKAYIAARLDVRKLAALNDLEVVVGARLRGTGIINFESRQEFKPGKTKPVVHGGVSVKIKTRGQRKLLPRGFFITLKNGNTHVAYRVGSERDDFEVRYSSSVSQIFSSMRHRVKETPEELLSRFLNELESAT